MSNEYKQVVVVKTPNFIDPKKEVASKAENSG
jgi:hypothetical protein